MCDINDIKCVIQHTKNMIILHPLIFVAFGSAVSLVTAFFLLIVYRTFGLMAYTTFLLCVWLSLLLRAIVQYMSSGEVVVRVNMDADGARVLLEHIINAALANHRVNEDEIVDEGIETDVEEDNGEEQLENADYEDEEEEVEEHAFGVINN